MILVTVPCNSRCKATTDTGHLTCVVLTLEGRGNDTALPQSGVKQYGYTLKISRQLL